MTSGANLTAPFLRYNHVFCYVKKMNEKMIREPGLKKVDTGPNVTLLTPYDDGVLECCQQIQGKNVVSTVQLYLNLINYKKRGEEAANFILNEVI